MSFERFPKQRPPLPERYAAIYASHYKLNRQGLTPATSLSGRMERWLHRKVAEDLQGETRTRSTLEIGAGTLNQLALEPAVGPYDIVEPFTELFERSPLLQRVRSVYADIRAVPAERRYDRITSVATFEHLCDLPTVVARAALLLAPAGALRVAIPSEGTPLWRLGWRLTTGLEYRLKYGLDYGVLMRYEHVNTAAEIEEVIRYFFRTVACRVFGLARKLSFYQFYVARDPDLARCTPFTASSSSAPGSPPASYPAPG